MQQNISGENKLKSLPVNKLIFKLGMPMIISMVLQALYNVVDSIFVSNMPSVGALANQALTIAFPVQILMIAIGVGTGVGLNAVLSRALGENDNEKANFAAGNGIFLAVVIYAFFLVFGLFFAKPFIAAFTNNETVIEAGASYLSICCVFSLGSIGYTVYERFLQSTGKTIHSTIAQISGALTNVVLDYVFIFPLDMGVEGAAIATVIGQFVSLLCAMAFHYAKNKDINGSPKYIRPRGAIIKEIYKIGVSAAIMQALLSVMMAGMNAILSGANANATVLVGAFGIYYKIQQIALFSAFGLSNTIITALSFNYGLKDKSRCTQCVKYGVLYTLITALIITALFEIAANPLSKLFALSGGSSEALIPVCEKAVRIGALSFVFMGFTVAVQGVLQALGYSLKPLVLSALRLVVFVFPPAFLFSRSQNVLNTVWWSFLIAEVLTDIFAFVFLKKSLKQKISALD